LKSENELLQNVPTDFATRFKRSPIVGLYPHVHFHVIPRMSDQPEDKRSMGIFAYLGVEEADRVSEPRMNDISQKVRDILLRL
jgi:diadenosine tetraphosphate (Ap4A) HIT family hydrolase